MFSLAQQVRLDAMDSLGSSYRKGYCVADKKMANIRHNYFKPHERGLKSVSRAFTVAGGTPAD